MIRRLSAALGAVCVAAALLAAPAQAAPAGSAAASTVTPPARLPWGDLASQPFKAGPASLSAAQAEYARTAPKGAPRARTSKSSKSVSGGNTYWYASAEQIPAAGTTGVYANGTIANPTLNGASHSLGEVAVMKDSTSSTKATVEIGWTQDIGLCGSAATSPCLFSYWWKNGVGQGYNAFGFVPNVSAPITAGGSLVSAVGTAKRFGIEYISGNWWLAYDTYWIGYYPDTLWSSTAYGGTGASPAITFQNTAYYQMFGEVSYSNTTTQTLANSCAWMGNGIQGTQATSPFGAAWGSGKLVTPGGTINAAMGVLTQDTPNYSAWVPSGVTLRYGGRKTTSPC